MSLLLQATTDPFAQKPLDIVALVQVTFTGLALLISAVGGVYAAVAATRAKRAEEASKANMQNIDRVQDNVKMIERNTNSMTTEIARLSRKEGSVEGERRGVAAGEEVARILAEGRRQGAEEERAKATAVPMPLAPVGGPVPVTDDRVAVATESMADDTKRIADAAVAAVPTDPEKSK